MKTWHAVLSCCLALCSSFSAGGQREDANSFLISYIMYPGLEDYIQLIEEIYTELGFVVTMLPTPADRGLVLLSEGAVDADLLRVKVVADKHANVLLVEPPLNSGELILLCAMGQLCQREVLLDKHAYILIGEGYKQEFKPGEFLAKQVAIPSGYLIQDMLKAKRLFYAIYAIDNMIGKRILRNFNYVVLKKLAIYHVINKKHAALLPQIEAKLREKLPEFKRLRQAP